VVHLVRENRSAPPGTGEDWALAHDWTPRNPGSNDQENVSVFSNCQEVELYLNGRSLGAKPKPADVSARTWTVPFESGAIKAVGRNDGKEAAAEELHTAGQPAKIVLTADHPKLTSDWDDVAFITAKITDAKGEEIPWADDLITFKLDGPGKIFAVDNGDRLSHESYQASERHAYRGECLAILHATGRGAVTLSATAANLAPGQVKITTVAAAR